MIVFCSCFILCIELFLQALPNPVCHSIQYTNLLPDDYSYNPYAMPHLPPQQNKRKHSDSRTRSESMVTLLLLRGLYFFVYGTRFVCRKSIA